MEQTIEKYEPVVATPLKNGETAPVLDEESFETLVSMLKSNDEANHKMAQLILNTCDIRKSIYWIWRLSRSYYTNNMVNLRTKASREFRDKSDLFSLAVYSAMAFGKHLSNKGWLTPDIYQKIEDEIVKHVGRQVNNQFYDVSITIKEEYKELAQTKTSILIK